MEGLEHVSVQYIKGGWQLVLVLGPGTRPGLSRLLFEKRRTEWGGHIYRSTHDGIVVVFEGDNPDDPDATGSIIFTEDGFEVVEHPRVLSADEANLADPDGSVVEATVWTRNGVETLRARDITGVTPDKARELLPPRFSLERRGNGWMIVLS